jgi:hypothetical protein
MMMDQDKGENRAVNLSNKNQILKVNQPRINILCKLQGILLIQSLVAAITLKNKTSKRCNLQELQKPTKASSLQKKSIRPSATGKLFVVMLTVHL